MSTSDESNSHRESDSPQEANIVRHRSSLRGHIRKPNELRRSFSSSCTELDSGHTESPSSDQSTPLPKPSYKLFARSSSHSAKTRFFPTTDITEVASLVAEKAEEFVLHVWKQGWKLMHHQHLPHWLRDNDFLLWGHRPELNSFRACFRSVFRMHTETINIWTHLLGCIAFLVVAVWFLTHLDIQLQEKAVFSAFFLGAILCLGFSCLFHTVYCHSESVCKVFSKLDYVGISLLIIGSFVPWLYYAFYCKLSPMITYLSLILVLGGLSIIVSMLDFFAAPKYRPLRAGLFIGLGLSALVPTLHYIISEGFWAAVNNAALGWLSLMAILYISGAVIYAMRIPERLFPGKCDIWFQSHQIFHILVVAAAFVHFYAISISANHRLTLGECVATQPLT